MGQIHNMRGGTPLLLVSLMGAMFTLAACDQLMFKGERDGDAAAQAMGWPFVPVELRIHPFTTITLDEQRDAVVLDLKIEARDQAGDLTKAVGDLRIELRKVAEEAGPTAEAGERLYAWNPSLMELENNTRHYNPTLRTYDFKLRMSGMPDADQPLLVTVQLTDPAGQRLHAEAPVSVDAAE